MTPRLSVTSVDLFMPVIFMTLFSRALPVRYSDTVTSMPIPLTSWKPASGPSVFPVPRSTRKLNWTYGRSRSTAMSFLLAFQLQTSNFSDFRLPTSNFVIGSPLPDAEDDELGRRERGDADEAHEPPVVEIVLGHRRAIALHEKRLLRL